MRYFKIRCPRRFFFLLFVMALMSGVIAFNCWAIYQCLHTLGTSAVARIILTIPYISACLLCILLVCAAGMMLYVAYQQFRKEVVGR